jgi:lipopolysaccharide transport system ATP-binding protein
MKNVVIQVDRLSKQYRLGTLGGARLVDDINRWWARLRGKDDPLAKVGSSMASNRWSLNAETLWALNDVSFEVKRGEVLGIIGRNGAGKSTLLKILSRVTSPTSGEARIKGRIASLLEVGTGFHPELTGRENIYLNGAILGMTKAEIRAKFDEIVAFSEVENFIDTPVKRYSSGMYVRLAFAVAAHLEPEILIVDEVLAVGDAAFQNKCLGKMQDVAGEGRTVLFVSHNMQAVRTLCHTAIVLGGGRVLQSGEASEVTAFYEATNSNGVASDWTKPDAATRGPLSFERVSIVTEGSQPGITLVLKCVLRSRAAHRPAFVAVDILDPAGSAIMQAIPSIDGFLGPEQENHEIEIRIAMPPLVPSRYAVSLWAGPHNTETLDQVHGVVSFEISDSPTTNRTFPHHSNHGYIVPRSTCVC